MLKWANSQPWIWAWVVAEVVNPPALPPSHFQGKLSCTCLATHPMPYLARGQGQIFCSQTLQLTYLHPGHQNQLYYVAQTRCLTQGARGKGGHLIYTQAAGQIRGRAGSLMLTNPPFPFQWRCGAHSPNCNSLRGMRPSCYKGEVGPAKHRAWTSTRPQMTAQTKNMDMIFGGNMGLGGQHRP